VALLKPRPFPVFPRFQALPPEYRQRTIVATDLLPVYQAVVPGCGNSFWGFSAEEEVVLAAFGPAAAILSLRHSATPPPSGENLRPSGAKTCQRACPGTTCLRHLCGRGGVTKWQRRSRPRRHDPLSSQTHAPRNHYRTLVPEDWHATGGKEMGLTVHIERFFGTLRHRCARLVRKTLSFSRKMENHIGALWYFIRQYNLCRA
jgi:hypothetical protein